MTGLERRCRRLLRAYPAWYRQQRGEEMLATLLEASPPGARWPRPRDARALITGGLCVRAWGNQRPSPAAGLRLAGLLGAALALGWYVSQDLGLIVQALTWQPAPAALSADIGYRIAADALSLAAVVAAWFAPRRVVAVFALAAAAMWEYGGDRIMAIQPAVSLVLLVILISGRQRLPRSWLWLVGALSAAHLLSFVMFIPALFPVLQLIDVPLSFVPWVILGAVALWAAVDARPAIAVAFWIISSYLPDSALRVPSPYLIWTWQWYLPAAGSAVLAAAAMWRLRRQAAL